MKLIYDKSSREFWDENLTDLFYDDKETRIDSVKIHDKVFQKQFANKVSFHFRYLDKFSTRLSFYDEQMTYKYNIIQDTVVKYNPKTRFGIGYFITIVIGKLCCRSRIFFIEV